jgi:DNA-binding LytR/AlgR family response regulator
MTVPVSYTLIELASEESTTVKIVINENPAITEPEIIINCRETDEQILRICAGLRAFEKKITGLHDGQTFLLSPSDILYADTVDRKTFLYSSGQVYETPLKLYELEERLAGEDFIRITKSCILNFGKVKSLRGDFGGRLLCTLDNGESLSVSRQYAVAIKQKLGLMKGEAL